MTQPAVESGTVPLDVTDGRRGAVETEARYRVAGEGPPVVLLHGIGLDAASVSWRHTLPALASEHRVYALDFPGHGRSPEPRVRYTQSFFVDVLRAFITRLDLGDASLVGTSMGGGVALGYALEHDVERLVLAGAYGLGRDAPWRPAASGYLRIPGAATAWWKAVAATRASVREHLRTMTAGAPTDDHVDDVYAAAQRTGGRAMASWQRSEFRPDGLRTCYLDRLSALESETLFIHGTADPLLPDAWSERAAARTDGSLTLLDGVGHWPAREAAQRFDDLVADFLGSAA